MIPLSVLVRVCVWDLGQARISWSAHHGFPGVLLSKLWLSYCAFDDFVCFDEIINLHPMNEKNVQWLSH